MENRLSNERVAEVIYQAVDAFNEQSGKNHQLKKSPGTILFGKGGQLDSLALVSLIIEVEEKIADELGVGIVLADERALSQKNSPFLTLQTLTQYVSLLIDEHERQPQ
jgi:acyl carrier protein